MKGIKEKAEEHAPYTREDSWSKTQKCIIAQTSFEAGANYVLDHLSKTMHVSIDAYLKDNLFKLIKELKK